MPRSRAVPLLLALSFVPVLSPPVALLRGEESKPRFNGYYYCVSVPLPRNAPDASDTVFVGRQGSGDASCQKGGTIELPIPMTRYVAPLNSGGTLFNAPALVRDRIVTRTAILTISTYTANCPKGILDENTPPAAPAPPRYVAYLNNKQLGVLNIANLAHVVTQFEVPIEELNFPNRAEPGQAITPVMNRLRVELDSSAPNWCAAVSWAALTIDAMAPLMLVHGTNATSKSWELRGGTPDAPESSPVDYLSNAGVPFEHRIDMSPNGSPSGNAAMMANGVRAAAKSMGVTKVHLVTHSKGATDARDFLNYNYISLAAPTTDNPKVLSLFSLGTPSQGTILADYSLAAEAAGTLNVAFAADLADEQLVLDALRDADQGNWLSIAGLSPAEPARSQQTIANMATFNASHPKVGGIPYFSLAGNADRNSDNFIDIDECRMMLASSMPETVQLAICNRLNESLGRTRQIQVGTVNGPHGSQYRVRSIVTKDYRVNDLVSAESSTHCRSCGFADMWTYDKNHSALKCAEVMRDVVDKIKAEYPLAW